MGLFDLFRRAAPQPQPVADTTPRRFTRDRSRMFDIALTSRLADLFAVPKEQRDGGWAEHFFDTAWCASVELPEPNSFVGPDGFTYLRLNIPRQHVPFDSQCLGNLAETCLKHGIGAAFFASPDDPPEAQKFVLSLGLIDSLWRYDSPDGDPADADLSHGEQGVDLTQPLRTEQSVEASRQVLVGTPSADYLPPYAAAALLRHLEEVWGLRRPRVALIVDTAVSPGRHLLIGRKRSEFPADAPIDRMMRTLFWYLTPGRAVMLLPEDWSMSGMTPLSDLT